MKDNSLPAYYTIRNDSLTIKDQLTKIQMRLMIQLKQGLFKNQAFVDHLLKKSHNFR